MVEASFAAWRDATGGPYDLLAEDAKRTIVGHSLASRSYTSKADFIDNVIRPFGARIQQGLRPTIRGLVAEGDAIDASGIARDGQTYANTYTWFWRMHDGRVVEAHAFFDSIAFNDLWQRVTLALNVADPYRLRRKAFGVMPVTQRKLAANAEGAL